MLHLFTFCVDLNKYSINSLKNVLNILVNSIEKTNPDFKLIIFTNFDLKVDNKKIELRKYYDNGIKYYNNSFDETIKNGYSINWRNLSFNKINIWKDLYDETKKNYTWIDLDTIFVHDISYVNDIPNFFIINGANSNKPNPIFFSNTGNKEINSVTVPRKNYIQGNVWKLDINLYNKLIECYFNLKKQELTLRYDLQDLYNYYIYILNKDVTLDDQKVYILGKNIASNSENGLGVYNNNGLGHPNKHNIRNLVYDNKGILRSKHLPKKEIHIISFVMGAEITSLGVPYFNTIFKSPNKYIL